MCRVSLVPRSCRSAPKRRPADMRWPGRSWAPIMYSVWATDKNGNYTSNIIGNASGTSTTLESIESSFHQDLNGDGQIGIARDGD